MERRLYEAAVEGSVVSLINLLQEDPLILDRCIVSCYVETPLHIASMLGHVKFVKEILSRKPDLAQELDSRKSSPLHLSAAKGYLDIVKELVLVNPEMCLAHDQDGRNPLHIAVIKGHVSVLKELVQAKPNAARALMVRRETILHLCVKHNQLEAMKFLVETMGDHEFVNSKDDDGNTILHLAVADKQIETIKFLITRTTIDANSPNASNFTALDMLAQSKRDVKDLEIGEILRRAGAISGKDFPSLAHEVKGIRTINSSSSQQTNDQICTLREQGLEKSLDNQNEWLERKRNSLMVVASLIATMAFQVGVNPPGGVWQDTYKGDSMTKPHNVGNSVMADNYPSGYTKFLVYNTIGFVSSLSIILLLISGLPLKRKLFMWILMVIMWVAITSTAMTYATSLVVFTPPDQVNVLAGIIGTAITVWIGLMAIIFLVHTIRLIMKTIRNLTKFTRRGSSRSMGMNQASV